MNEPQPPQFHSTSLLCTQPPEVPTVVRTTFLLPPKLWSPEPRFPLDGNQQEPSCTNLDQPISKSLPPPMPFGAAHPSRSTALLLTLSWRSLTSTPSSPSPEPVPVPLRAHPSSHTAALRSGARRRTTERFRRLQLLPPPPTANEPARPRPPGSGKGTSVNEKSSTEELVPPPIMEVRFGMINDDVRRYTFVPSRTTTRRGGATLAAAASAAATSPAWSASTSITTEGTGASVGTSTENVLAPHLVRSLTV